MVKRFFSREETRAAIKLARAEIHAKSPMLSDLDGMSDNEWSPFVDLPPEAMMNAVLTLIEGVSSLMNETEPTPLERLTDILGNVAVFINNVQMVLAANGDDSECDRCMVGYTQYTTRIIRRSNIP